MCVTLTGSKGQFPDHMQPDDFSPSDKMVYRGCQNDELISSPWDDGWAEKDHCKNNVDGLEICTCKAETMCNGTETNSVSILVALSIAIVPFIATR